TKTLFIVNGDDAFVPWSKYLMADKKINNLIVPSASSDYLTLNNQQFIQQFDSTLQPYSANGYAVIIDSICFSHPQQLAHYYGGYNLTDKLTAVSVYFQKYYTIDAVIRTPKNNYFKIVKSKEVPSL
ncbi:MAG TPA: hypothetical protein VG603_13390, partial [Chitinophagales bacterium]|nr:hypothetical protein [Chitinophagales bacterium]